MRWVWVSLAFALPPKDVGLHQEVNLPRKRSNRITFRSASCNVPESYCVLWCMCQTQLWQWRSTWNRENWASKIQPPAPYGNSRVNRSIKDFDLLPKSIWGDAVGCGRGTSQPPLASGGRAGSFLSIRRPGSQFHILRLYVCGSENAVLIWNVIGKLF